MSKNTNSIDLELDSSQYLKIADGDQTGLDLTGDFTFEFWLKAESSLDTVDVYQIINKSDLSSSEMAYELRFVYDWDGYTEYIGLYISDDGSAFELLYKVLPGGFAVNTWTHYAVSWDASESTATFYLNGVNIGTDTGTKTSIHTNSTEFKLGAGIDFVGGVSSYFDGLLDEVRIWNDIRTDIEISDNFMRQLNGDETNLVAYWRLNDDANDQTSNNNDLTAVNSPVFSTDVPFLGVSHRTIIY